MLPASAGGGETHAKHTHQQSYCTVCFDTARQSGGDAPYCKTAIAACWALPKLPSGRWAAPLPLVPLLLFTSLLNCVTPPLSLSPCLALSLLVSLAPCFFFPAFALLSVFLFLHLYLLAHPAPSRPGSRAEIRGSVKIEGEDEGEGMA